LLFHGASWQWSGHVVRPTAQAQTAWSSQPLYDILLRSHFVSRNKIFRCAYFSMHFGIKFLLFNDFPLYLMLQSCSLQVVCCTSMSESEVTGTPVHSFWSLSTGSWNLPQTAGKINASKCRLLLRSFASVSCRAHVAGICLKYANYTYLLDHMTPQTRWLHSC